jgi:hypothetical protein
MGWLIKMSENRVDPTVAGLFLVAFITLVFGFFGLEVFMQPADPMLGDAAAGIALFVGIMFVVLMVSAIRCGNAFAAALFGFVAISLVVPLIGTGGSSIFTGDFAPFLFFVAAILYVVFAIVALFVGAPKLLVFILVFVALLYLFVGLVVNAATAADAEIFGLLAGVFGLLAGVISMYLGFALATQKAPVF